MFSTAVGSGPVRIYPPGGDIQVPLVLHGVSEEAAPGARDGERGEPGAVPVPRPGHSPRHPALTAGHQGEDAREVRGGGGGERGGPTSYQPAGSCTRHGLCPGLSCHADIHIQGAPSSSSPSPSSPSSSPPSPSSSPHTAGKCPYSRYKREKYFTLPRQAGLGGGRKVEPGGRDGDKIDLSLPITSTYLRKMRGVSSDGPHWPRHPVVVRSTVMVLGHLLLLLARARI